MKLLTDLFTTDYGLMSIIGIAFMLCMVVFFIRLFMGKMDETAASHTPGQSGQSGQSGQNARPPRPH
jgi:hypothetical protein